MLGFNKQASSSFVLIYMRNKIFMRFVLAIALLFNLASCSSGPDKRLIELAYAKVSLDQSTDAYQICTEDNIGDLSKCATLIKLMQEDQRRLERLSRQ